MPLSEHTGSHSSAEHEQSLLQSANSISLPYDIPSVLQGKDNLYFIIDFKNVRVDDKEQLQKIEMSIYFEAEGFICCVSIHVSALTHCMKW